jgi:CRP-like cAMP-binding protein
MTSTPPDRPPTVLSEHLIDLLVAEGRPRRYPAGSVVFAEGDPPGATLVVIDGVVDIELADAGRFASIGRGELVGDMSAVDGLPRSATAIARTDVDLRAVDAVRFAELVDTEPELSRHLVHLLTHRVRLNVTERAPVRDGVPVDHLAAWILARQHDDGWIDLSLEELAAQLGASRELLSRAIDHLVARGAVALERGRLLVRSEQTLAALATPPAYGA